MVKGKRWKKGQSGVSNPETRRFRNETKSRNFNFSRTQQSNESGLTTEALAKFDPTHHFKLNDQDLINADVDNQSIMTFESWASNWSDCTNATFNKVHKYWRSNSVMHKEVLAVLAAVTEVIKSNNGNESETEYFAALMTGLESVDSSQIDSCAAFMYLISLAIKKVPVNILKAKYMEILSVFTQILEKNVTCNNQILLKSTIMCICWLIKEQEMQVWQLKKTKQAFNLLLELILHPKPKVRKCSHEAVKVIFNSCSSPAIETQLVEFLLKSIEQFASNDQSNELNFVLSFIKRSINDFNLSNLKSISEYLLRLLTLKNVIISSTCFQTFYILFSNNTPHLNADTNAQLINVFYDNQPNENDPHQVISWLAIMDSAFKRLFMLQYEMCCIHLPRIFKTLVSMVNSHHENVLVMILNVCKSLMENCVKPPQALAYFINDLNANGLERSLLNKLFNHVSHGLNYEYHTAWKYVLHMIAACFTSFNHVDTFSIVKSVLTSIANIRESDQFSLKSEIDFALSKAIRTYGPKCVLEAIDLNITGDEDNLDYPRSWLLPLLSENIENTELSYFCKRFMPIALKLKQRVIEANQMNKPIESKVLDNLRIQIWSMLPAFCTKPIDFNDSFKLIAKAIGDLLEKTSDIRNILLNSLRNLIEKNNDENKKLVAKYSKNYLPILFNMYTLDKNLDNDKNAQRQLIMDTIKSFLKISEQQLINDFMSRAIEKYLANDEKTISTKYSLLDLINTLIPFNSDLDNLKIIKDFIFANGLNNDDKTIQKKSYKILHSMLLTAKTNEQISQIVIASVSNVQNELVLSLSKCHSASKPQRLKSIQQLLEFTHDKEFLKKILPEIILSTREVNAKSRDLSYTLINQIGKLWLKSSVSSQSEPDSFYEYIHFLMIGLAASQSMIECTCLALSSLINENKDHLNGTLIDELIDAIYLLINKFASKKEIVLSSLNLLKAMCVALNDKTLALYLNKCLLSLIYVQELVQSNKLQSQRIKLCMKLIIKKLMKKFSFKIINDALLANIDVNRTSLRKTYSKLLVNLKKLIEKEGKNKKESSRDDEKDDDLISKYTKLTNATNKNEIDDLLDDDDTESDDDKKSQRTNKSMKSTKESKIKNNAHRSSAWLKENKNEDPLNLLDTMAMKSILTTKPLSKEDLKKKKEQSKSNRGFGLSKEGKLIIDNEDDDNRQRDDKDFNSDDNTRLDNKSIKSLKKNKKMDEKDDIDEMMDDLSISKLSNKIKSKEDKNDKFVYRPGGSGIHRSLSDSTLKRVGAEFKAKKAKGDVKRTGKIDPYAYLPFNRNKLNKRKKARLIGEYKGIVKAAQNGARKSKKMKKKN